MDEQMRTTALDAVRHYAWTGFHTSDDIVEIIDEAIFEPGQIDQQWLRSEIRDAFRQKRIEEASWPQVTDCDRLDQVFRALEQEDILSLHNAGYTLSDGISDVAEVYHEVGREASGVEGYCFYHGQDLETVMKSGDLWLAFGHIDGDRELGVQIGERIRKAFEAAGFAVEWDGSVDTRLRVKGICWQRRDGR